MENLETISAPEDEAQLNPDLEAAKQAVAEYRENFLSIAKRAERSRVQTREGRKIGDPDIREEYALRERFMNNLLEKLFDSMPEDEKTPESGLTEVSSGSRRTNQCDKPDYTTVRFQLSTEPVPEFHDEYIIPIGDEDLGKGRKYDL